MKTRSPRRYFHRHYVNVVTPRPVREGKDPTWSLGAWVGFFAVAMVVIGSVVYLVK